MITIIQSLLCFGGLNNAQWSNSFHSIIICKKIVVCRLIYLHQPGCDHIHSSTITGSVSGSDHDCAMAEVGY